MPNMRRMRVTEAELQAMVRKSAHASPEDIAAIVLETSGEVGVIPKDPTRREVDYEPVGGRWGCLSVSWVA